MAFQGNNRPHMLSVKESFSDQYFLLNFIMGSYLGPDVYSDNPRRSAFQRLAEGLPPYTSKNLGVSFVSISQLESLYYYVLRNAHRSLVLKPDVLHMYLKGNMPLPSSELPEDCWQFTSLFPTNIHAHKRYSENYEIVKGIALIDHPVTSYMKKENLERFKHLSSMNDLKIDKIKSLSYEHGYQKSQEKGGANCVKDSGKMAAGSISNGNNNSAEKFQETCKGRHRCNTLHIPAFPHVVSASKQLREGANHRTCKGDGPVMMPLLSVPDVEECTSDASITLTGTATMGIAGPPVGVVDIGVSQRAYFFQVALPGVQRDYCEFSCEIESNGRVHIQGSTSGGKAIKKRSRVFHIKLQQLCPSGQFTLSFSLPGPVDPRLFKPNFRPDGIFEGVIIKHS
ncbi:increased DNA methylation 3 isoform X2 [Pistacia vera]|uniref:increased DNA methylation 3 isoform X2 n=1 Tax=Pistacia vera TaxID=55513 RepID=UPI00126317AD|nr:increased DNA methylation 3 isoform X2 [Pistacia vera]